MRKMKSNTKYMKKKKSFSELWKKSKIGFLFYVVFSANYWFYLVYFIYLRIAYLIPGGVILFQYPITTIYAVIFFSVVGLFLRKELLSSGKQLLIALAKNVLVVVALKLLYYSM